MSVLTIQSFSQLEGFLTSLVDPVYLVDPEGNLVWVNNAYRRMFGLRPRQRKRCYEVAQMETCNTESCLLREAMASGQPTHFIETLVKGSVEPDASCTTIGFPLFDENTGKVAAVLGVLRDISVEVRLHKKYQVMLQQERDRKEILERMVEARTAELVSANEALNRTNQHLDHSRREIADILQNIKQAIVTIDASLAIGEAYSRHAETVFQTDRITGLSLPQFLLHGPGQERQAKDLEEWLKLVFHSPSLDWKMAKEMVQRDYQYLLPGGKYAEMIVDFEPIREGKELRRIMILVEDVTEKRALERSLDAKEKEIHENIEHLAEIARLDREIYDAFLEEGLELIDGSTAAMKELRDAADRAPIIAKMFRNMHTLKGNAMSFGLVRVAAKAHWVEDAFSALRVNDKELTEATIKETEEKVEELRNLFNRIREMASKVLEAGSMDLGQVRSHDRPLKVEVDQSQIDALIEWIQTECPAPGLRAEMEARVRSLRFVPMSRLYRRFPKMVGDMAEQLHKNINEVALVGGEIALDPEVFNKLCTAVVHLLRNSVDHGIELPAERMGRGKSAFGTVSVRAVMSPEDFRIEVEDDGRGLDPELLVVRAREKGLIKSDQVVSPHDALQIIFLPGFSTARAVTDISGRGVGMDVVKTTLEEMGGSVEIDSQPGRGTRFSLRVSRQTALGEAGVPSPGAC